MITYWKRVTAVVLIASTFTALLTGCWDSREIDSLFIVTGIGLDVADSPGQTAIMVQAGETKQENPGSGEANSGKDSVILLKTTDDTVMGGLTELNRDSNHKLLMHHNQVLLFGTALAQQGLQNHIDLFMRHQQARLEVPMVVVEGRGEEPLTAKLAQESISGIFLAGMFDDLAKLSVKYRVRLIDFASRLLEKTTSPVMPIVRVTGEGGKQEIKMTGMAVFKGDKMIGRLSNDEVMGYIWSWGKVKKYNMETADGSNTAVFHITRLDCKREVTLRQDGGVRVALSVTALLNIGELRGFNEMKPKELMPRLINLAQDEIQGKITDSFEAARKLKADIYGYGTSVYRKYPKEWKGMKDRWDKVFSDIDFSVRVRVRIPGTGQIVQSLEMEENAE